ADFVICGCLPYAMKDNVVAVSSMLNVGHLAPASSINGLASREQWLAKWKAALAKAWPASAPAPTAVAQPAPQPTPAPQVAAAKPAPVTASEQPVAVQPDMLTE